MDPTQTIIDAEIKTSYHVQVRYYRSGPPKRADGRHGDILIEDKEAPPEAARWLRSAKCTRGNKSTLKGAQVFVWIDDEPVGDTSIEIPDAEDPARTPKPPEPQAIAIPGAGDAKYWRDMATVMEGHYHKDKARYEAELEGYETQLDEVAKRLLAAMEESDKRIAAKLAEEQKVIDLANSRLEALHEELQRQSQRRSASMDALDRDSTVFEDLRTKLAEVENKGVIDQVIEISKDPEALQGLAGAAQVLVGLWQQVKAGGTPAV